jgi:hypothetical protein
MRITSNLVAARHRAPVIDPLGLMPGKTRQLIGAISAREGTVNQVAAIYPPETMFV